MRMAGCASRAGPARTPRPGRLSPIRAPLSAGGGNARSRQPAAGRAARRPEKSWSDLEGMDFAATSDKTGHISLFVTLNGQDGHTQLRPCLMFEADSCKRLRRTLRFCSSKSADLSPEANPQRRPGNKPSISHNTYLLIKLKQTLSSD